MMTTVYREEISKAEFFENAHEGIAAIMAVNGNSSELVEVRKNGNVFEVRFITSRENGETINKVETMSESEIVELLGEDFFYHEENEIGLVFFIHLCKDLNKVTRYFSREEIRQCSLDYYSAYKHKTEDMNILLNEISAYHELDYYTNILKNI